VRICLISREYPPDTGWGGIATFTYQLARGLKEAGHDVEVVSLAGKNPVKTTAGGKQINLQDIPVHRVSYFPFPGGLDVLSMCIPYSRYMLKTCTALWNKCLELHQEKPFDVVDSPELLAEGVFPSLTKAMPMVIRLYTPHSKFIAERFHNVTPSFDHSFVAMTERMAMLSADVLTSPSIDLAKFVAQDLHYPLEKIAIARNPIDTEEFCPEGRKALPSDGRATVLFVGRLEERKGIGYLIAAVPKIVSVYPNVRFVIVGDDTNNAKGHKSQLAELRRQLAKSGCSKNVTFIPRVPLSELPDYYRSADICVVPSVYDNSPYTCLEAMSCGKPVIGTTGGGTGEYLVDGDSGILVAPKDSDAIAQAAIRLLSNPDLRKYLGDNARRRVIDNYHRREIAAQMEVLYEQARTNFARRNFSLYRRDSSMAIKDATSILFAYDKMMYELLYLHSFRFRLTHWGRLIIKRPRLFAAKVSMALLNLTYRLTGRRIQRLTDMAESLRSQIAVKEYPAIVSGELIAGASR